jgi:hypothetical protein
MRKQDEIDAANRRKRAEREARRKAEQEADRKAAQDRVRKQLDAARRRAREIEATTILLTPEGLFEVRGDG